MEATECNENSVKELASYLKLNSFHNFFSSMTDWLLQQL